MERELGAGYSFERKSCFVCGSLSHLIKDCDYYEKKMARELLFISTRVIHANVRQATPAWTNSNRVNKANQFTPRPVQLNNIRPNFSTASRTIKTGRVNVNTGKQNVSSGSLHVSSGTHIKSGTSSFNTGKQHVNSGSMYVNSGTKNKSGGSRVNTGKQNVNSGRVHVNTARVTSPVLSNQTSQGMLEFCGEKGIKQEFSNARTPQQNGVAERMNRTLIEAARTMLADSLLPTTFWAEAVNTACYTFNRFDGKSDEGFLVGYSVNSEELLVVSSTSRKAVVRNTSYKKSTLLKRSHQSTPLIQSADDIWKVSEALEDESWVEAMQEELLQFKLQQVWVLVDLPNGAKVIGTKWVYRNKKDKRGVVVRNKVRLVAQGHKQEDGSDDDEVFAPVARIEAIRLFLAFASFMGFIVYQMDVKSAFLYGTIDEEVYVSQPLLKMLRSLILLNVKAANTPMETVAFDQSMCLFHVQTGKSTTGVLQFLGLRLISWQCKKTDYCRPRQTTEAGNMSLLHIAEDRTNFDRYYLCFEKSDAKINMGMKRKMPGALDNWMQFDSPKSGGWDQFGRTIAIAFDLSFHGEETLNFSILNLWMVDLKFKKQINSQAQPSSAPTPSQSIPLPHHTHLRKKRKSKEAKDAEGQDQEVPFETDQGDIFVTPEKSKSSGEAQEEQIKPDSAQVNTAQVNTGEVNAAAVNTGEVNTAQVNTAELNLDSTPSAQVNTGEVNVIADNNCSMLILVKFNAAEVNTGVAEREAKRVQAQMDAETQRQIDLDALLARKIGLMQIRFLLKSFNKRKGRQYSVRKSSSFLHDTIATKGSFCAETKECIIRKSHTTIISA
ncbi:retrovirus-related pol polyprotein from transposon TNT 1-94 [Tanacetum coccineum]